MAKLMTIKITKDNEVNIRAHLPEGMSEAEVNEHLTIALPMAVAVRRFWRCSRRLIPC